MKAGDGSWIPAHPKPGMDLLTTGVVTFFLIGINIASTVALVLLNKRVFLVHEFRFPTFLIVLHQLATVIFTRALVLTGLLEAKNDLPTITKLQIAMSDVATLGFINRSLMFNSVGAYQVLKFLNIPCMYVIESYIGTKYPTSILISLAVLIAGVGMATVGEVQFSLEGTICGCAAAIFTAFHQILIKRARDKHELGPLQIMFRQAPPTVALLIVASCLTDNIAQLLVYPFTQQAMLCMFATCLLAILVIWSVVTLVTRTSPVTFQVVGLLKTTLTFLFGFIFFQSEVTWQNVVGICLATIGFVWYTFLKLPKPPAPTPTTPMSVDSGLDEEGGADEKALTPTRKTNH